MSEIEKPDGFDLRERRAEKAGDGKLRKPEDVLYAAAERVKAQRARGDTIQEFAIYWVREDTAGDRKLVMEHACSSRAEHAFMLQNALHNLL